VPPLLVDIKVPGPPDTNSRLARMNVCTKVIFSVPTDVEILGEACKLLIKQRKRMLPKLMKKLVYTRYEKRCTKCVAHLEISHLW